MEANMDGEIEVVVDAEAGDSSQHRVWGRACASREVLKRRLFIEVDRDGDGVLNKAEMRLLATMVGFEGSDEDWSEEWEKLCNEHKVELSGGISECIIMSLLDEDSDAGCFVTDKEIMRLLGDDNTLVPLPDRGDGGKSSASAPAQSTESAQLAAAPPRPPGRAKTKDMDPKATAATIFFVGAAFTTREQTIRQQFTKAGVIKSFYLFRTTDGRSRGMGRVEYSSPEEARDAIELLNQAEVDGRVLAVKAHEAHEELRTKGKAPPEEQRTKGRHRASSRGSNAVSVGGSCSGSRGDGRARSQGAGGSSSSQAADRSGSRRGAKGRSQRNGSGAYPGGEDYYGGENYFEQDYGGGVYGGATYFVEKQSYYEEQGYREQSYGSFDAGTGFSTGSRHLRQHTSGGGGTVKKDGGKGGSNRGGSKGSSAAAIGNGNTWDGGWDSHQPATSRIFFSGVPSHISVPALQEYFMVFGEVINCILFRHQDGRSRGSGVCAFKYPSVAGWVLESGIEVEGRQLYLQEDTVKPHARDQPLSESWGGGKGSGCSGCGSQDWVSTPTYRDRRGDLSAFHGGHALHSKGTRSQALPGRGQAVASYDDSYGASSRWRIGPRPAPYEDEEEGWFELDGHYGGSAPSFEDPNKCVFFSNVPFETTESYLRSVFERAGVVKNIKLFTDSSGKSRGMGVVEYTAAQAAQRAYYELHEQKVSGRLMIVDTYDPDVGLY